MRLPGQTKPVERDIVGEGGMFPAAVAVRLAELAVEDCQHYKVTFIGGGTKYCDQVGLLLCANDEDHRVQLGYNEGTYYCHSIERIDPA